MFFGFFRLIWRPGTMKIVIRIHAPEISKVALSFQIFSKNSKIEKSNKKLFYRISGGRKAHNHQSELNSDWWLCA